MEFKAAYSIDKMHKITYIKNSVCGGGEELKSQANAILNKTIVNCLLRTERRGGMNLPGEVVL